MIILRSLVAAIRFLTRLPCPGPTTRSEDLPPAIAWFPLVGAGVGAAVGGIMLAAGAWWPAPIAAVLAVATGVVLTGAFHEDAVSDSADALGGGYDTESVQRILHDSRIGSYGSVALVLLLLVRWAALIALGAAAPWAAALAMAWGRWTAGPLMWLLPPLSGSSLGRDIGAERIRWPSILASLVVLGLTAGAMWLVGSPWPALAAGVAVAMTLLWAWYLQQRLGGQSGDLLGAGNQLVEVAVLLLLTATPLRAIGGW